MEEAKKMKCYKRLIFKQIDQVSCLFSLQFLSYLPKRFTHLCRALVSRRHIGAPFWCSNIAAGNQQKHPEFTFSIKALSFHSRTSIRGHKHIFYYLKWLYCWKSRGETFFQRDSILVLVSRTVKTRKFKLLYFRNKTCYGNGNLYKDLLFVYLQPGVNKNS